MVRESIDWIVITNVTVAWINLLIALAGYVKPMLRG
jgi:hypothetical protein